MDEDEHYGPGQPMNAADVAAIIAERDRLRVELVQVREEHKVTWTDWKRQRRRAEAAGAERDRLRAVVRRVQEAWTRHVENYYDADADDEWMAAWDALRALDVSAEVTDG